MIESVSFIFFRVLEIIFLIPIIGMMVCGVPLVHSFRVSFTSNLTYPLTYRLTLWMALWTTINWPRTIYWSSSLSVWLLSSGRLTLWSAIQPRSDPPRLYAWLTSGSLVRLLQAYISLTSSRTQTVLIGMAARCFWALAHSEYKRAICGQTSTKLAACWRHALRLVLWKWFFSSSPPWPQCICTVAERLWSKKHSCGEEATAADVGTVTDPITVAEAPPADDQAMLKFHLWTSLCKQTLGPEKERKGKKNRK